MKNIQRTFIPGSKWVYFKIYTGVKTADKILINNFLPVVKKLERIQIVEKWFFIRYNDPDFHLRIRFLLKDESSISEVINLFHKQCVSLMEKKCIWKVQLDTYEREIERYDSRLIDDAESIFHFDSECILFMLKLLDKYENENYRWMISLKMIDRLLSVFCLDLKMKQELLEILSSAFKTEFGFDKFNSKQFNAKYRENKKIVEKLLGDDMEDEKIAILSSIINKRDVKIAPIVVSINNKLRLPEEVDKVKMLLASYIHMSMNRLFRSKNRMHELLLYDILARYYASEIAKKKYAPISGISKDS